MIDRIFWVEGDWFNNGGTVDEQTYMRRCPMTQHVLETDEHFTGASFQNKQASCIESVSYTHLTLPTICSV